MIKSMTGYAKKVEHFDDFSVKVEAKTLNSKYIDTKVKLPRWFNHLEIQILNLVKDKLDRGKVDLFVDVTYNKIPKIPKVNNSVLSEVINLLKAIKVEHGIHDEIKLENIFQFDNVLHFDEDEDFSKEIESKILETISKCLEDLDNMRIYEGSSLEKYIYSRLDDLENIIGQIDSIKDKAINDIYEKIKKRIGTLFGSEMDLNRLYQEAALLAERADIEEEVTRVRSHIVHFRNIMKNEFPVGKKLDFMCQELYREFNTIGSKSGDTFVINLVVDGKNIVDKIREQVQNLI
ncbi:MAG: YicC family protein [Calditerrivibrio sp.]|nr:YicC family protein [Calditerrivibrio sp.]MCA1932850.1 YicC family protein [Calditerrivibrio sp.]